MIPEIMDFVKRFKEGKDYEADEMESLNMEEEAIGEFLQFTNHPQVYLSLFL